MSSSPAAAAAPVTPPNPEAAGGTQATVAQNVDWFQDNDAYMASQSRLEHYRLVRLVVERELRGAGHVLDVGNGGFFNYDTNIPARVTALDLFLKDGPGPAANTAFKGGSILDIPFPDGHFDCVLLQNVFHHITGKSVGENFANLRRCMTELFRCTAPGGKAVIVESTVPKWFNLFERVAYRPALLLKRGGHPVTFQYTPRDLLRTAEAAGWQVEEWAYVPKGMFILQFGYRFPSLLTPAAPIKLVLRRPAAVA